MSFQLLKNEIIDTKLCQGCGLCAGSCDNIEMKDFRPTLVKKCVLDPKGQSCGQCYNLCPQVHQHSITSKLPDSIYSVKPTQSGNNDLDPVNNLINNIGVHLLESKKITHLVKSTQKNEFKRSRTFSNPEDLKNDDQILRGRTGILTEFYRNFQINPESVSKIYGIVGTPCEISGATAVAKRLKKDILKIGFFCKSNYPLPEMEHGIINSPCTSSCPAEVNASGYIQLIQLGKYQEAVDLIREKNPLPSICGRICTHECENDCTLIGIEKPIAIRELKKFVTEWEIIHGLSAPEQHPNPKGKKVAVIGSGPAGLSAAYYLAKKGYRPTIFEKSNKLGGMLRLGVPQFRLPDKVLDHDIEFIRRSGVEFKIDTPIGPNLTFEDLRNQGYEAIFVGIGQYRPYELGIPGEDLKNVFNALDFVLKWKYNIQGGSKLYKDKIVGIIGGGSVAIDAAQTAVRMGAKKVMVIYRRGEDELPARREDYEHAKQEGIEFYFLRNPTSFIPGKDQSLKGAELVKMELCDVDASGRRGVEPISCTEYAIEKDYAIVAIGQGVDTTEIDQAAGESIKKNRGKIAVNNITLQTSIEDVFAGGDAIINSKNVAVSAVAHGHEAAISIDRFLKGKDLEKGRFLRNQMYSDGKYYVPKDVPEPAPLNSISNIFHNTQEIEGVFGETFIQKESARCLGCNNYCRHCQDFAAVNSDIAIGLEGSEGEFATVVAWTDKGKLLISELLAKGVLVEGKCNIKEVQKEMETKKKRTIIPHTMALRQQILKIIEEHPDKTIPELSAELNIPVMKVRYDTLRLVQDHKLGMQIKNMEPHFIPYAEEED